MTTYSALPMGAICYPCYPEDPLYPCIQPKWLLDIDTTAVQYWLLPGVPDIKFYLEIEQHIDIQNARYALGVRVFQNVSDIETMLCWVGIEGQIRAKVLKDWYQRITLMQVSIERERSLMPSLALPYDLGEHNESEYDSDQDGEYEVDDEYVVNHEMADFNLVNAPTTNNNNAFTNNHMEVRQVQEKQYNNKIVQPATASHDFWPLLNSMVVRDLDFMRLQMELYCPHIANEINWDFLLCEPCTDVSVMIFLYVTSVWQSRPRGKEGELAGPIIWSLALQLRVLVPSEQVLRVLELTTAAEEIPGLLSIHQWQ
ncbi:hypothetical protein EYB25_001811 [Talaromyces marneffei]|uniref:uncharacterized protein n=1 Tax=Talaromyces marneffei TaxID=37727 RepID=UPI0012AA9B30|nr:uncharacterized protein EYB26_000523 [Talaromyces marneffei]KAE8557105.1 hypothetical protein EYB25_001811 [Talaromyces marneffei]QGA12878.1 hypothetical protein EYB26_000523 [Talaromyces marneffei]